MTALYIIGMVPFIVLVHVGLSAMEGVEWHLPEPGLRRMNRRMRKSVDN